MSQYSNTFDHCVCDEPSAKKLRTSKKIHFDKYDHQSALLERLNETRNNKDLCDFTIKVGSLEIFAHKNILSAGSDYFAAMLLHDTKEKQTGIADIKEADPFCIKKCIDFIYTGMLPDFGNDIEQLMYAAHLLQLTTLCDEMLNFLMNELKPETFFGTQRLANFFNCKPLMENCSLIASRWYDELFELEEFLNFEKSEIENIIVSRAITSFGEINMEAVLYWVKFNPKEREKYLDELLSHISLSEIPFGLLDKLINTWTLISNDPKRLKMFKEAVFENSKPIDVLMVVDKFSVSRYSPKDDHWSYIHDLGFEIDSDDCDNSTTSQDYYTTDESKKDGHFSAISACNRIYFFTKNKNLFEDFVDLHHNYWKHPGNDNFQRNNWMHLGKFSDDHGERPPVVFWQDYIYIIGGDWGCVSKSVESFDIATQEFLKLPDKPRATTSGSTPVLFNEKIFCCGGMDADGDLPTNVVECYDPETLAWTVISPMSEARSQLAAVEFGGKLYVFGGKSVGEKKYSIIYSNTVECYDPATDGWSFLPQMSKKRSKFRALEINGDIYAVGGDSYQSESIEKYSISENKWMDVPMPSVKKMCITDSVKVEMDRNPTRCECNCDSAIIFGRSFVMGLSHR